MAAPSEDGKDADAAIGRMGALLRTQEKQADTVAGGSCVGPGRTVRSGAQIAMVQETCDCEAPASPKNEVMFQKGETKGAGKGGGKGGGKGADKDADKGGGKIVGKGGEKGGGKGGGAKGPDAPPPPPAAAPSAVRVEVHVNPNWTAAAAPVRIRLGENSGLVSGVTTFGAIGGAQGGCIAVKGDCRGDCERVIYEWVHMDIDVNITYVRGMRAKAAHEAVHAQQMGNVFRAALQGIQQTAAFGCAPRATTERRLALCQSELLKEANRVGLRAISAWQAEREDFKTSSKDYRSDPMEREAFVEEDKGDDSGFPAGVEPPPEFRPPPPAPAPVPAR